MNGSGLQKISATLVPSRALPDRGLAMRGVATLLDSAQVGMIGDGYKQPETSHPSKAEMLQPT
ncbi:hypothetical protein [uncultured Roseovarius sp.]|uniref:hypothetical protein n=1 Tax=uncultured Roseovarius sp. TaxID=293344 RepID=UPI00260585CE|nr:hypothetical protein [uncultured Roseovarius sp.]